MNEEESWTMHGLAYDDPDCLRAVGIRTIGDLAEAMKDPGWYRQARGIGPRGTADILDKLESSYLEQDMD